MTPIEIGIVYIIVTFLLLIVLAVSLMYTTFFVSCESRKLHGFIWFVYICAIILFALSTNQVCIQDWQITDNKIVTITDKWTEQGEYFFSDESNNIYQLLEKSTGQIKRQETSVYRYDELVLGNKYNITTNQFFTNQRCLYSIKEEVL